MLIAEHSEMSAQRVESLKRDDLRVFRGPENVLLRNARSSQWNQPGHTGPTPRPFKSLSVEVKIGFKLVAL